MEWGKIGRRIAKENPGKVYRGGKVVDARKKEAIGNMPSIAKAGESLTTYLEKVRDSFYKKFSRESSEQGSVAVNTWVKDIWTDKLVADVDDEMYTIPFQEVDGEIKFADKSEWTRVEQQYIPLSESLSFKMLEAKGKAERGTEWEVTIIGPETKDDIIKEGGRTYIKSKNGRLYSADALKNSVPIFEGVKVYDNHQTDEEFEKTQGMRSVAKEWVGVITDVFWDAGDKAVKGTLKVIDASLRTKLVEAYDAGVIDAIGLSIDALGDGAERAIKALSGATMLVVEKINKALSVDVVADPAAGGHLARLVAAQKTLVTGDRKMDKELMDAIKKFIQEAAEKSDENLAERFGVLESEIESIREMVDADAAEDEDGEPEEDLTESEDDDDADGAGKKDEEPTEITEAKEAAERANKAAERAEKREQQLALQAAARELKDTLKESGLPVATQDLIAKQFKERVFETDELNEAIEDNRNALTSLSESGAVRLPEGHRISVSPITEWDQYELAFLRLLAGPTRYGEILSTARENKDKHEDEMDPFAPQRFSEAVNRYIEADTPAIPKPVRLSEWFYDLMGGYDAALDGVMRNKRLMEAAVTTSSMSSIVKNTVNLMVAADYSKRLRWWEPIVRQEDVDTLDDSTLVRVYGIGGLNVMNEGDAYTELSWSDEEETGAFVKRGGYIGVTLETFLRDKINVLRTIPIRLSNAWYNTVSELVSGVFTVNSAAGPVLSDTGALFNATAVTTTGGHANLLTGALSYSSYIAAKLAMRKQTDQPLGVGKRLNIMPRYVLVPADIENTGLEIRNSELVPAQSGGATASGQFQTANTVRNEFDVIPVPEWTDADNWALVADPATFPAIYLIWLRGRRTPEIFTANDERGGAMFTNDEIRYKVRMFITRFSSTYDCAPVGDFRPLHKSNV